MSTNEWIFTIQHGDAGYPTLQRTAHRFTSRFAVSVETIAGGSVVRLIGTIDDPERLEREFRGALLDDVLRARIEAETAPLRQLIVEAALRSALREPDADTDTDTDT